MRQTRIAIGIGVVAFSLVGALAQTPGTAFTYQGRLESDGSPASGAYDLRFSLWVDAAESDPDIARLGLPLCKDDVSIDDGLFSVQLDFGSNAFVGFPLWLQIEARSDATPGNCASGVYTPLSPRQPLTPTPYSVYAATAGTAGLKFPYSGSANIGGGALLTLDNTRTTGTSHTGIFWNRSTGDNSRAISGISQAGSGLTYGLYGQSNSTGGVGVHGESFGLAGVRGIASSTTGINYGLFGESASTSGRGVFGIATSPSGSTYGGRFESASTGGRALAAHATAVSGANIGLFSSTDSPDGYAGYFVGARNYFSGSVGIGTVNPAYRLHVTANTPSLELLYVQNTGAGRAAYFESLDPGGPSAVLCYKDGGSALQVIGTFSTAGSVATDSPMAVAGGADTALAGGGFVVCGGTNSTNLSFDNNEIMARNNGQPNTLALNAEGGNVNLIQSGTGNVGIGTSGPQFKLDVNGAIRPQGGIYFNGALAPYQNAQGGNFLSFGHPGLSEDHIWYYNNVFWFYDSPGGGDTEHPNILAGDFYTISDIRLKTDASPIDGALEKVGRLQGIRYRFDGAKVDPLASGNIQDPKYHLGFAAQEVERVAPEAVNYSPEHDVYSVSYGSLVPLLVEAIKEQQSQIDALQAKVDELTRKANPAHANR